MALSVKRVITDKRVQDFDGDTIESTRPTEESWSVTFKGTQDAAPQQFLAFESNGITVTSGSHYLHVTFIDSDRVSQAIVDRLGELHYSVQKSEWATPARKAEHRALLERMAGAMGLAYPPAE